MSETISRRGAGRHDLASASSPSPLIAPHTAIDPRPHENPFDLVRRLLALGEIDWHADRPLENPAALDAMLAVS